MDDGSTDPVFQVRAHTGAPCWLTPNSELRADIWVHPQPPSARELEGSNQLEGLPPKCAVCSSTLLCPVYFSPHVGVESLPGLHCNASPKLFKPLPVNCLGIDLLDVHPRSHF